jgi:hypothetical protein
MLAPSDRDRLIGADGKVLPEFEDRLRAMRLTTLAGNPLVTVEEGRIRGIFELLPVIEQGAQDPSDPVARAAPSTPDPAPKAEPRNEELRTAAEAFFRSVRASEYRKAMGMVAPGERRVFVGDDGRVKRDARRRLSAMDTSSWDALTLEDGKLTGVVLIIPPRPPESGEKAVR